MSNLALAVDAKPSKTGLDATWDALSGATKYQVSFTDGAGNSLFSQTTTGTESKTTASIIAPATAKVTVTPYASTRRGRSVTVSKALPDVTPPTGAYSVSSVNEVATLHQDALTDNVSAPGVISRTVDWGDGNTEGWASGTTISHSYQDQPARYDAASVTLEDAAHNTTVLPLVVVIEDTQAPSATYAAHGVAAGPIFAKWSSVTLDETPPVSGRLDNWTPNDLVTRTVDWGDGTTSATLTHVYAAPGDYSPTVTLKDEAGNSSLALPAGTITVAQDTTPPVATLKVPAGRKHVASWRKLHGTAKDVNGTGVRNARVRVIEKRTKGWYAYKPSTRTWVHTTTKALAWTKAGLALRVPGPLGKWTLPVAGLKKGTLLVRYSARDNVGNTSKPLVHSQQLTLP